MKQLRDGSRIDVERAVLIDPDGTEHLLPRCHRYRGEPSPARRPSRRYTVERLPGGCSIVWPAAWWPTS